MKKAVLITGASTGIGHAASLALAQKDYKVFACVRNSKDQENLNAKSPNIESLILDVTKPGQIKDAYDLVSQREFARFDVINNAGIAVTGPVETVSMDEWRNQFAVNVFGLVEVTQMFLPLLRKTQGRVVNISSMSGKYSTAFLGAYSASKFAVEAISDSLRWELAAAGVKVIVIEPGPIATPIWGKNLGKPNLIENAVPSIHRDYYRGSVAKFESIVQKTAKSAISVDKVTAKILKALEDKNPPSRMLVVGAGPRLGFLFASLIPSRIYDKLTQKVLFSKSSAGKNKHRE